MKAIKSSIAAAMLCVLGFAAQAADASSMKITDASFNCLSDMTPVRGFFVDNLAGDMKGTLAAANSATGSPYPAGSVVQLVPTEVMVKLPKGTSPATNDWEFFELSVSQAGSKIDKRGFVDVVNRFGGNCLDCHAKAEPQWDLICETGHGCDPIPLTRSMLTVIQKTDPRCKNPAPLSEEEKTIAIQLQQMFK